MKKLSEYEVANLRLGSIICVVSNNNLIIIPPKYGRLNINFYTISSYNYCIDLMSNVRYRHPFDWFHYEKKDGIFSLSEDEIIEHLVLELI